MNLVFEIIASELGIEMPARGRQRTRLWQTFSAAFPTESC